MDRYNDNHTQETYEDREWENVYRKRRQHDKVIRSTHGVNCTGSCSWNIYTHVLHFIYAFVMARGNKMLFSK
ncbi:hypothetical protein EXW56_10635 [Bacillus mycoides]|nr:hypothetical protein EXW56_10635 [Bacillus mycoides]